MPRVLHFSAASCAPNMTTYCEASSLSALAIIPPVTRAMVSFPDKSVTCTKVSLKRTNIMCATPKTFSPSFTCGHDITCFFGVPSLLLPRSAINYLRNKSWKPECALSFKMGWRILVYLRAGYIMTTSKGGRKCLWSSTHNICPFQ